MNVIEAIIFVIHYFVFFLAICFFCLKFHKKENMKILFYAVVIIWLLVGFIDFLMALIRFVSVFN